MNRRLFVRHVAAGLALPLLLPAQSIAFGDSTRDQSLPGTSALFADNQLGTPQHVTISHVYSPERTSVSALKRLVEADLAQVNALLGTDFALTNRVWSALSSAEFGSYSVHAEKNGVRLTWQGLARIGGEVDKPTTRLLVYGSQGVWQTDPASPGYQVINWQGQALPAGRQSGKAAKPLNRRTFLMA